MIVKRAKALLEGSLEPSFAWICLLVTLLFGFGLVMVFNTSSADILDNEASRSIYGPLFRQIIYGVAGVFGAVCLYRMGYKKVLALSPALLAFFTFLLLLVFVPGIGVVANGARRWINLFGLSIQPSELVKYTIPLFFIHSAQKELQLRDFLKLLGKIAVPMALILIEPDNRTTLMIGATLVMLFGLCAIKKRFWVLPLIIGGLMVAVFASTVPYVAGRLQVYLHPEMDLKGKGHQPYQSKIALGSGGFLGRGVGKSLQKLSYLPEAQNDYIVAILGEETGFVGILSVMMAYMMLFFLGLKRALSADDIEGRFVIAAMIFLIAMQAFINFGVVSGLLPSTGLNLPLFSQGGSSLVVNLSAIGLLLSVPQKA